MCILINDVWTKSYGPHVINYYIASSSSGTIVLLFNRLYGA